MVKPWIHPITQAKVNMFGTAAAAVKQMRADGVPIESIPDFMGGGAKPKKTFDLLLEVIQEEQEQQQEKSRSEAAQEKSEEDATAEDSNAHAVASEQIGHMAVV